MVDLESEENPVSIYINERLSEAYLPEVDRLVLGGELMAPVIFSLKTVVLLSMRLQLLTVKRMEVLELCGKA